MPEDYQQNPQAGDEETSNSCRLVFPDHEEAGHTAENEKEKSKACAVPHKELQLGKAFLKKD